MNFPVYLELAGICVHPHPVFEILAYSAGFRYYLFLRKSWPGPALPIESAQGLMCGCIVGALIGSRILAWLEAPQDFWNHQHEISIWFSGKTIVGGILGGWAGVEIVKAGLGIRHSTGDVFVFPLMLGMGIGRIGCFLTGLEDHTCGSFTSLPWGVDFGDGPRHPTQLYDILFLAMLALYLRIRMRTPYVNGHLFKSFAFWYLSWRFAVEFIKPRHLYFGLSAIQVACLCGMACTIVLWSRNARSRPVATGEE